MLKTSGLSEALLQSLCRQTYLDTIEFDVFEVVRKRHSIDRQKLECHLTGAEALAECEKHVAQIKEERTIHVVLGYRNALDVLSVGPAIKRIRTILHGPRSSLIEERPSWGQPFCLTYWGCTYGFSMAKSLRDALLSECHDARAVNADCAMGQVVYPNFVRARLGVDWSGC